MTPEKLDKDSVGIFLSSDDEESLSVAVVSNISKDVPEDVAQILVDAVNGLNAILTSGLDMVVTYGATLRYLKEEMELNDGAIVFEPDEELLDAISDAKIVPFNKNKMN